MRKVVLFFNLIFQRYTPDPFVIATLLTFLVFLLGVTLTPTSSLELINYWGNGFWKIIAFTLQMVMVLVGGYIIAISPPMQTLLKWFTGKIHHPLQAVVFVSLISSFASWLNWGLGLVVGAFVALELARKIPQLNFKVLVASAYTGFIVWHGGLSGSIPLVVNSEKNFSFEQIGRIIPTQETLFAPFNLVLLGLLFVSLPFINMLLYRWYGDSENSTPQIQEEPPQAKDVSDLRTPAEKLESSSLVTFLLFVMSAVFVGSLALQGNFQLDLNNVNFLFFFLGLILHKQPKSFIRAAIESSEKVGPLLIQYPLYAGIMAMISQSGLAAQISQFFIHISTPETFPIWTFISAGLVNIFVPSGGGQWAIQAPIVIPAAQALGVDLGKSVMAVAWGDAWTNLAQPFWALPVLAIAGLKVKDIMAHCIFVLMATGLLISTVLFLF